VRWRGRGDPFIRVGEGFIRQVNKVVGGTKSVVAGFEHQRE